MSLGGFVLSSEPLDQSRPIAYKHIGPGVSCVIVTTPSVIKVNGEDQHLAPNVAHWTTADDFEVMAADPRNGTVEVRAMPESAMPKLQAELPPTEVEIVPEVRQPSTKTKEMLERKSGKANQ